jgi:hypothetical protein
MIANRSHKESAAAKLRVEGVKRLQEFDRATRKWRSYAAPGANGVITVELKPGDGRLFWMVR